MYLFKLIVLSFKGVRKLLLKTKISHTSIIIGNLGLRFKAMKVKGYYGHV